jgi:hypothetical protein
MANEQHINVARPSWLRDLQASRLSELEQAGCLFAPQAGNLRHEETK